MGETKKRADSPHRRRNAGRVADELVRAQTAESGASVVRRPAEIENRSQSGASGATRVAAGTVIAPRSPMPLLRAAAPRSAEVLAELQDDPDAPAAVRASAASTILDRVLGRPAQAVALAVATVGPVPDSDALEALARAMVVGSDENP